MYETNQDNARIRFTVRDAIFKIIFPFNVTIDSCMDFLKKQEAIRDNYCVKGFTYGVFQIHIFPHTDLVQRETPKTPRKNTDPKNSKYGFFSRSEFYVRNI